MSSLMGLGTRAMFANMATLQSIGNNIANANTKGYSRQETQLETAGGQFTGAGFFGQGVNITTISRSYDRFLTTQSAAAQSVASYDSARASQLKQLENVFTLGEKGLGQAASQLLNAFVDVANNPGDTSARQVVLTRAQELSARFKAAGEQLDSLQGGVSLDMKTSVKTVNSLAQQVAGLNKQISALNGTAHSPNDLLDQRDQLVAQISSYINVTTIPASDGSVGLFVGGGMSLVLGANANTLKAATDPYDPAKLQLALQEGGVDRLVPGDAISGGSIAGLMKFQNEDLTDARNLLGQMAVAISGALNQQQALGLDLGTPASMGSALFAVGAPKTLPANSNAGNASIGVTISDFTHAQASDYEVRYDGSNYSIVRLSDDKPVTGSPFSGADLAAGVDVEGLTIQLNAGTPAAGDRFLLQTVTNAAQDMRTVLTDPKGLAAASPVTASFGVTNTGTATVASLGAVDPSIDRTLTANFSFTSDNGDYNWETVDASGTVTASGTGTWTPGSPISLNGFELKLNGVPKNNDTISVKPTIATGANNGNALALANLDKVAFVGAETLADGTLVPGKSITDAYAAAVSNIGVRVQSANSASNISSSFAAAAESARVNKAGVNLDEEAARLIQFQQAYQASAKVLQVAQTLFDTLLQAAGQ